FSSRRRHTRSTRDWSSDVCSSDLARPYALMVLLVAVSYLALVACWQAPSKRWAAVYGLSLALAMYASYGAAYALAPQVVALVAEIGRASCRESVAVSGGGGCTPRV